MSTDNNNENNNGFGTDAAETLSKKLRRGWATKEERGLVLKTINTQLAMELVNALDNVREYTDRMKAAKKKVADKFYRKLDEALECNTLDVQDLFDMLTSMNDSEIKMVELYRKVLQGGNRMLFDDDCMSENDKVIQKLIQSLGTEEKKQEFLEIVKKYMRDNKMMNVEDAKEVE